jgi:hypothetical protein
MAGFGAATIAPQPFDSPQGHRFLQAWQAVMSVMSNC